MLLWEGVGWGGGGVGVGVGGNCDLTISVDHRLTYYYCGNCFALIFQLPIVFIIRVTCESVIPLTLKRWGFCLHIRLKFSVGCTVEPT